MIFGRCLLLAFSSDYNTVYFITELNKIRLCFIYHLLHLVTKNNNNNNNSNITISLIIVESLATKYMTFELTLDVIVLTVCDECFDNKIHVFIIVGSFRGVLVTSQDCCADGCRPTHSGKTGTSQIINCCLIKESV